MLRRKPSAAPSVVKDRTPSDASPNVDRDVPPLDDELTPRELMSRLTAEGERRIDAAFGRKVYNS